MENVNFLKRKEKGWKYQSIIYQLILLVASVFIMSFVKYTIKNIKRELNSIVRIKKVLIFMKLFPKDLTAV